MIQRYWRHATVRLLYMEEEDVKRGTLSLKLRRASEVGAGIAALCQGNTTTSLYQAFSPLFCSADEGMGVACCRYDTVLAVLCGRGRDQASSKMRIGEQIITHCNTKKRRVQSCLLYTSPSPRD